MHPGVRHTAVLFGRSYLPMKTSKNPRLRKAILTQELEAVIIFPHPEVVQ